MTLLPKQGGGVVEFSLNEDSWAAGTNVRTAPTMEDRGSNEGIVMRGSRPIVLSLACLLPMICGAWGADHFVPDTDPSRIKWWRLAETLGPVPDMRGQRFGVIIKTLTNEYWRLMAAGYRRRAAVDGVKLDIQAAQSESDPTRQLASLANMIGSGYKGLLISPISDSNLQPAIAEALAANIPLVDVDGAVVDEVPHFVGAVNRDMGVKAARWFISHEPRGGAVAVIRGQPGVYSTVARTAGFVETLAATKTFQVVAMPFANWDRQQAYDVTLDLLRQTPRLKGLYCNNDTMAMGALAAVKSLNLLDQVHVIGTDGTRDAYGSIRAGELTGTVDIFPSLVGEIGLDIAERLATGQSVPRVVETPLVLITRDNASRYSGEAEAVLQALREDAKAEP